MVNVRTFSFFILIAAAILPQSLSGSCNYRNRQSLPPEAFVPWACWGCYSFNKPEMFEDVPLTASFGNITVDGVNYEVPGLTFKEGFYPFDYTEEKIVGLVKETFKYGHLLERWKDCTKDGEICCSEVMIKNKPNKDHCPAVWDGWSCFYEIPAGETAVQVCSQYAYEEQPPRCNHYSYKECTKNATWKTQTDYSTCIVTPKLIARVQWQISWLTVSVIICIPSVIMLILGKGLQTQKLNIIRNLLIAIIVRNFIVILVKSLVIFDELTSGSNTVMGNNKWPCKFLSFLEKLSGNIVFACMLLEGIFLHQLLTNVFRTRQTGGPVMIWYYGAAAGITVTAAAIWAVLMSVFDEDKCWQVLDNTNLGWINDAPRLFMLLTNFTLLLHIIWTLWKTFHSREDDDRATIRTVKAALICLPLFGLPYIFLMIHPNTENCGLEQFYYFLFYMVEAVQGILVAILHCYMERDVKKVYLPYLAKLKFWSKYDKSRRSTLTDSEPIKRVTVNSTVEITKNINQEEDPTDRNRPSTSSHYEEKLQKPGRSRRSLIKNEPLLSTVKEDQSLEDTADKEIPHSSSMQADQQILINNEIHLNPRILFRDQNDGATTLNRRN